MTTDKDHNNDAELEALFQAARSTPPQVPDALLARVQADALAQQPRRRRNLWEAFVNATGGVPAVCGLATAACVGLWIGIAPPDVMPDLGGIVLGVETTTEDETAAFGWDIEEG